MPIHFEPNSNPNENKSDLSKYYRKGVVVVCPHQQFDIGIFNDQFKCKCGTRNLRPKRWSKASVMCDISA